MLRTHTCGELRPGNINDNVILCGWVHKLRDMGGMTFVDLRDRYGITQLVFNMETNKELCELIRQKVGREYVIKSVGKVAERSNKNLKIPTGEIEILAESIEILNESQIPPFTIEDNTDGGEEQRMKYRYLDLRRNVLKKNMELRHKMGIETRNYLNLQGFIEIETPFLIKSTPEGARDYVVPSRVNPGQFYALPQSPQTFKQLLMVAGYDRYFQIVRCFRDEDLRADRQPEFTQIDCEMSFVTQEDILNTFEGLAKHLFKSVKGIEVKDFPRISYADAMKYYGSDKPDIRFEMKFAELNDLVKGKGFNVFDEAELVVGICARGCGEYTRKELDALTEFVRKPQVGAKGLVYVKCNNDGTYKSSVDKFYSQADLKRWADRIIRNYELGIKNNQQNTSSYEEVKNNSKESGDLLLILAGEREQTQKALSELRLELGNRLGLRNPDLYTPLWVTDFPLLEWNEESQRFYAMHHPFTSPKPEDINKLETNPGDVRANAYDMVINGIEIGGGSIRIHNKELQKKMFKVLGFTDELAQEQFGFLMTAFDYGAPPHGGIAFGFDRWCAVFGGSDSIRDFIAFPKNNAARDLMIESPAQISDEQLKELGIKLEQKK
jgi:aspartyl-tRNA synthetase